MDTIKAAAEEASAAAIANPGEVVAVGTDEASRKAGYEASRSLLAEYLGVSVDTLKGAVVLGVVDNGDPNGEGLMVAGNLAGDKSDLAAFLIRAAVQLDDRTVTTLLTSAALGMLSDMVEEAIEPANDQKA
jgi:hypothetical protein